MSSLVEKLDTFSIVENTDVVTHEKIVQLQDELLKMPQADIVTEHTFLEGIYDANGIFNNNEKINLYQRNQISTNQP